MRYHFIKNKLLSTLLVFAMLFTLLPTTAWAAAATGTASGTAGYNNIAVILSGASQFAADEVVQNTSSWELIPTGGTQTILGITKHGPQYVSGTATATGSGESHAVHLNNTGNTVQVGSAIVSSGTGTGVHIGVSGGGSVTVGSEGVPGQIIGKGYGIWVRMGITPAIVTVYGDVEGASHGISASDDSTITINGNVKSTAVASGYYGVYCAANSDPSNIIINGNVEGDNGV